jgi:hypothetical protein
VYRPESARCYDNQPTTGASTWDYMFLVGFGWELK